ncbi:MAG TPA: leucyl aminopeptidase [Alphaproteobacteria bacterium]|jgi:leucyl aminopeptidase|nr:leucyl aminopeptidase [Alphaproteobacteria bacterium]
MEIGFVKPALPGSGTIVLAVFEERGLGPLGQTADKAAGGQLSRAIASSAFTGKADETLAIHAPAWFDRVLLVGFGKADKIKPATIENAGGTIYAQLNALKATSATVIVDVFDDMPAGLNLGADLALGMQLRSYRFDKYRTVEKPGQKATLAEVSIATPHPNAARTGFGRGKAVADAVFLTRDLVSEPANILYPESFAERARERLSGLGVTVEILGESKLAKLGMGALLGVGQGSERETQLVVMNYQGAPKAKNKKPVAFVGKGVTFDTGGISLKPGPGMEDMKWDMAGAGAVTGLIASLAGRKAKVNAVGVVALVENMPDGKAQRPGDIVKSMSGQTIEVLNTDAEGRLALADALWYTIDRFKPQAVVDLATLTGAIIIALGSEYAGLFSNDDTLAAQLLAAGVESGEKLWRLPLDDAYDKQIDTDAADMKNISDGRGAGSAIGAVFLKRFVKDTRWAHLDIAGVAWSKKDKATVPKGATAFGVRLLDRFVADNFER